MAREKSGSTPLYLGHFKSDAANLKGGLVGVVPLAKRTPKPKGAIHTAGHDVRELRKVDGQIINDHLKYSFLIVFKILLAVS